ncbi:hypothetical protein [Cellulomonas denverensis]|nr:hypothetical protein [Cellulomonas denverensis]GIG24871.1 hypothetical protein Cde04nite_11150 [Cellulomonas denverensis]
MIGLKPWHIVAAVIVILIVAGVVWLIRATTRAAGERRPRQ